MMSKYVPHQGKKEMVRRVRQRQSSLIGMISRCAALKKGDTYINVKNAKLLQSLSAKDIVDVQPMTVDSDKAFNVVEKFNLNMVSAD